MTSSEVPAGLSAPDAEVRRQTVAHLAQRPDADASRLLIQSLGDADWRVRQEAVATLSRRALGDCAIEALVSLLARGDVASRNGAVVVLGAQGHRALSALDDAWNGLDADGRKLAVEAAARTGLVEVIERLQRFLDDDDENVRMAVVEAMASVGVQAPHLARPLLERLLGSGDEFFQRAVLESLVQLGWVPGWGQIEGLLVHPVFRDVALRLASDTGAPQAARHFVVYLEQAQGHSWDQGLRALAHYIRRSADSIEAARAALKGLGAELRERLARRLLADVTPVEVQASAMLVLAAAGDERVAPCAVSALANEALAGAAREALTMLDGQATPALQTALQSDDDDVVVECVELLVEIALRRGWEGDLAVLLRPLAEHAAPNVVRAWLNAVAAVGDEHDATRIQRCWVEARSTAVRVAAAEAWAAWAKRFPAAAREAARGLVPTEPSAGVVALTIAALDCPITGDRASDLRFLCETASSQHQRARAAAVQALASFEEAAALDAIEFALRDEEAEVRMNAVRSLGQMRDARGQPVGAQPLLELVETTVDPMLGSAALEALSQADEGWVAEQLTRLVRESTAWRAVGAVEALCRLSGQAREAGLRLSLRHRDADVALAGLAAIAGEEQRFQVDVLSCLEHPAREVRRAAIESVMRLDVALAVGALQGRAAVENDAGVLEVITQRLALLEAEAKGEGAKTLVDEGQTR